MWPGLWKEKGGKIRRRETGGRHKASVKVSLWHVGATCKDWVPEPIAFLPTTASFPAILTGAQCAHQCPHMASARRPARTDNGPWQICESCFPFLVQKNIDIISYFLVDDIKMFYSGILNNLPDYSLFLSPQKYIFKVYQSVHSIFFISIMMLRKAL